MGCLISKCSDRGKDNKRDTVYPYARFANSSGKYGTYNPKLIPRTTDYIVK